MKRHCILVRTKVRGTGGLSWCERALKLGWTNMTNSLPATAGRQLHQLSLRSHCILTWFEALLLTKSVCKWSKGGFVVVTWWQPREVAPATACTSVRTPMMWFQPSMIKSSTFIKLQWHFPLFLKTNLRTHKTEHKSLINFKEELFGISQRKNWLK